MLLQLLLLALLLLLLLLMVQCSLQGKQRACMLIARSYLCQLLSECHLLLVKMVMMVLLGFPRLMLRQLLPVKLIQRQHLSQLQKRVIFPWLLL